MFLPDEVAGKAHLSLTEYQSRASASNQFKGASEAFNQLRYGFFGAFQGPYRAPAWAEKPR